MLQIRAKHQSHFDRNLSEFVFFVLYQILADMGIDKLIHGELNGYADVPVTFDDIVHKAVIEMDENGAVAAAATGSFARSMPDEFHCDHPFIFTINDRITQEILFAGVFRGPE